MANIDFAFDFAYGRYGFLCGDMVCGRCRCNSFSKRRPHHNFFSVRNLASNYLQMLDSKLNGLSWIYDPKLTKVNLMVATPRCTCYHYGNSSLVRRVICPKGYLSKTYRHRVRVWVRARTRVGIRVRARFMVRVRVRFSVKFRNLYNYISDKWPFGQVTLQTNDL